jgi:hypothetical protein
MHYILHAALCKYCNNVECVQLFSSFLHSAQWVFIVITAVSQMTYIVSTAVGLYQLFYR